MSYLYRILARVRSTVIFTTKIIIGKIIVYKAKVKQNNGNAIEVDYTRMFLQISYPPPPMFENAISYS